ncbi:Endo-beta-N-acetylglucosaminidase [Cavenderia fasciculata]|uniref:Endo-beta-N-acetylglucosaminidase n=1 Tax=Cavenderia fasciculata TaxID=261658 RepID=F4Q2G8_CACFS|nr:Endo-beta-N-acetylglucosaminidase [Cavenderia fasciculata]EGG16647.1 Endo-beta-N-acetylglucosaminidase [Cavenderia fasciculata]|eukprot:XP_004355121.1 Endo-beta-N-acetylglucosaminidase [Cavenderia fasciculata]
MMEDTIVSSEPLCVFLLVQSCIFICIMCMCVLIMDCSNSTFLLSSFLIDTNSVSSSFTIPTFNTVKHDIDSISCWLFVNKPLEGAVCHTIFEIEQPPSSSSSPKKEGLYIDSLNRLFTTPKYDYEHYYSHQNDNHNKVLLKPDPIKIGEWLHIKIVYNSLDTSIHVNNVLYHKQQRKEEDNDCSHQHNQKSKYPIRIGDNNTKDRCTLFSALINNLVVSTLRYDESSHLNIYSSPPSYPDKQMSIATSNQFKALPSLIHLLDWRFDNTKVNTFKLEKNNGRSNNQQIIHCHDMMGGYLPYETDEQGYQGSRKDNNRGDNDEKDNVFYNYTFKYWQLVDTFIYFTHQRISIPPIGWINSSHKNGVKILGTIITEWEGGVNDACRLVDGIDIDLNSQEFKGHVFIDRLVDIAVHCGFDGWFINIESDLPNKNYAIKYKQMLEYFTETMHRAVNGSLVIWYDSVLDDGTLVWQNELNQKNKIYFDACDGIFLNYKWNEDMIKSSSQLATDREHQVYVGTDVFGRGTFGGGKLNSYIGVQKAYKHKLSSAIFAPAWTWEANQSSHLQFQLKESNLWVGPLFNNLIENGCVFDNNLDGWNNHTLEKGDVWVTAKNEGMNRGNCFKSSYHSVMSQEIDLLKKGYSKQELDLMPIIYFEFYHCGTGPKFNDFISYQIELRDENHKSLYTDKLEQEIITTNQFKKYSTEIESPLEGVRYIYIEFIGRDIEHWAGHFGPRITSIHLHLNVKTTTKTTTETNCILAEMGERVSKTELPFINHFNVGKSNGGYFINGKQVMNNNKEWINLSDMDVMGCYEYGYWCGSPLVSNSVIYDDSYFGGSCLNVKGKLIEPFNYFLFTLFNLDVKCLNNKDLMISYTFKWIHNQQQLNHSINVALVIKLENGPVNILTDNNNDNNDNNNQQQQNNSSQFNHIFGNNRMMILNQNSDYNTNNWTTRSFSVSKDLLTNQLTIKSIQLLIYNNNNDNSNNSRFDLNLGELNLQWKEEETSKAFIVENDSIKFEKIWNKKSMYNGQDIYDILCHWNVSTATAAASFTMVYLNDKWLGKSFTNRYCISSDLIHHQTKDDDNIVSFHFYDDTYHLISIVSKRITE